MRNNFLTDIIGHKRDLIRKKESYFRILKEKISGEKFTRYGLFRDAISQPGKINLIAEIKKASPSKGLIRDSFDVGTIAGVYVKNGAAAISVLTEDKYFLGKPPYVSKVSEHFSVPVLTKDFIIDEGQIYETFSMGTSAILLIAAILEDDQLKHLMDVAASLDLDCLVEVHDKKELDRAVAAGANIIGINNRDLRSFEVSLDVCKYLIPQIPKDKIIVAESGIDSREQIQELKNLGASAVLIGETFMRADNIAVKMKEIMGGPSS